MSRSDNNHPTPKKNASAEPTGGAPQAAPLTASAPAAPTGPADGDGYYLRNILYYLTFHVVSLGTLFVSIGRSELTCFVALYCARIFFITAGYHIYFSHRAFKTSRLFQFILAVGAQTSGQGGVLNWALAHRHHHAHSDRKGDYHSPAQHGLWHSHMGWLLRRKYLDLLTGKVAHFAKFPELVWLDRYHYLPWAVLGLVVFALQGWPGLVFGYATSTVCAFHATFAVNSLAHVYGSRPYDTPDQSRNNWLVSIWMFGGGWHNNHHRYPASARQGFQWWEIDLTYYFLRILGWLRIIWDINEPPKSIVRNKAE